MILVAFVDLFYSSWETIGLNAANLFFLIDLLVIYALNHFVTHIYLDVFICFDELIPPLTAMVASISPI
jgi:hypothetical protein